MRELFVTKQFEKDFRKIPRDMQEVSNAVVETLLDDPRSSSLDIKKLKGYKSPPLYRVRVGSYRLVYSFSKNELTAQRVCHRKDIYKVL